MGILDSILQVLTGTVKKAEQQPPTTGQVQSEQQQTSQTAQTPTEANQRADAAQIAGNLAREAMSDESLETVLGNLAQATGAENYKSSIVDLLKLFGMDSSLSARQNLAKELGYEGDLNDTAPMNEWLHQKVMQNVIEHHGRLQGLAQG